MKLHFSSTLFAAVFKPSDFDEPLTALGPVNEIDITIPQ